MINNSNFILPEIPEFHPVINKYDRLEWWREEKKRCLEGYWVSGKWMPPELYYYINFHTITFESGETQSIGRPWLRDIDFEKAYIYAEATGFSGFELDDKYTCDRRYGPEKEKAIKYKRITEVEANSKIYVPARDYLKKIHSKNLGKPLYKNQSKHLIDLESRGGGKSMWSSGCILHNFLFDGARDYDKYLENRLKKTPLKSEGVVGAIDAKYSNDLLSKVKTAIEYLPGKTEIVSNGNVEVYPSPLMVNYSGSLMAGKFYQSSVSKSLLHHRTFQDNPLAANGTRPNRVWIEECGFMDNFIESWQAIESTQAAAQFKRLTIHALGTGGLTKGGAATYTQEVFYNPDAYNCLVFDDTWENKGKIGYFLPATKALNEFKEGDDFITNEPLALESIIEEREDAKKATTRTKLQATIINKPIKPSEIFLRMEGTLFPTADLNSRLADLEAKSVILDSTYKVIFNLRDGRPEIALSKKPVIREFPATRGMDLDAPIELLELPKKDNNGEVVANRYIAGWDPVEVDGNTDITQSLQSIYVMDSWTGKLVAEYTARTRIAEEYYEQARRLFMYYRAVCNYENNIKGPYGYFKNKNSLYLLCETPEILRDTNLIKSISEGNKSLGTRTNKEIIKYALGLILSWLDEQAYNQDEGVRNLDMIESPALIKELISYSEDINTDRISALGMLMVLKEDRVKITDSSKTKSIKTKVNSPFFDRPFKKNIYNLSYK